MNLKPNQYNAALLLASGERNKLVADKVKVTPATISNWLSNPEFQVLINTFKADMLSIARDRLIGLSDSAVDVLHDLLSSQNDSVRLQACKTILSANGLIGDSEGAFLRSKFGIGPTSLSELEKDRSLKG